MRKASLFLCDKKDNIFAGSKISVHINNSKEGLLFDLKIPDSSLFQTFLELQRSLIPLTNPYNKDHSFQIYKNPWEIFFPTFRNLIFFSIHKATHPLIDLSHLDTWSS